VGVYVLRRLLHLLPILFVVSFIVFGMLLLLPGDPTLTLLGDQATQAQRAALRHAMGFDQPIPIQYIRWLVRFLSGDFGHSVRTQEPVGEMLLARLPVTLELTVLAMLLSVAIGLPLGVIASLRRGGPADNVIRVVGTAGIALPHFWAGILLIMLLSVRLGWLPPSGYVPLWVDPVANLRLMVMPCLMLGISLAALILRQTRAAMLQALGEDYIRTARAKGVSALRVVVHHALRNALIPIVTVIGRQFGALIGGVVITEMIFSLPGLGLMIVQGIFDRDFAPLQAAILVVVTGTLTVNLLTDLAYAALDKRVEL
jgi:peptide/nickel transport system permease protein